MPISGWDPIDPIMGRLQGIYPRSVLDIGVGTGQWGFLVRNYFDFKFGRFNKKDWAVKLIGIEGFADYRNPVWNLYDQVMICNALDTIISKAPVAPRFDAILMIEVLEHFEKEDGIIVLEHLKQLGKHLFFSYANMEQGNAHGNDYEIHRAVWTDAEILAIFPGAIEIHRTGVGKFFYVKT